MAYIDKIYGTYDQWVELFYWVSQKRPRYCKYFYPTPPIDSEGPITNLPRQADIWLWAKCEIPWVRERLKEQYGPEGPRKR